MSIAVEAQEAQQETYEQVEDGLENVGDVTVELTGWRQRVEAARERGHFTDDDVIDINNPAACLCHEAGNKSGAHVRMNDDTPYSAFYSDSFAILGDGFTGNKIPKAEGDMMLAVECNDFDMAERCIEEIEEVATMLLRERLNIESDL